MEFNSQDLEYYPAFQAYMAMFFNLSPTLSQAIQGLHWIDFHGKFRIKRVNLVLLKYIIKKSIHFRNY